MPTCAAANCRNKHGNGMRLFRWPSAPERAHLWLEMCGRAASGWQPKRSSRLCEKHFDSSQFEEHRQDGWRKLKPNAVPTRFTDAHSRCSVRQPTAAKLPTMTANDRGITEGTCKHVAKLTTVVKQNEEDLHDVVLDLQVSGDHESGDDDVGSNHVTHEKQEMDKTSCASDATERPMTEFHCQEHSYSLLQHWLKQMSYQCPLCARKTTSLKLLTNHLAKHSSLESGSGRRLCAVCGKEFAHPAVLASHTRTVHEGRKAAKRRKNVKPLSVSANQQCHLCAVCGRQFLHVGAFQRHSRSHVVARDRCYLCSVCGHVATTSAALYRHSAVHVSTDQRPLACADCGRRFIRASDLRKHLRVHTGDRPYLCSVCGRAFSRTYTLLVHGRTHAAKSTLQPCARCRRTFSSAAGLAAHKRFCCRFSHSQ